MSGQELTDALKASIAECDNAAEPWDPKDSADYMPPVTCAHCGEEEGYHFSDNTCSKWDEFTQGWWPMDTSWTPKQENPA